MGFNFNGMMQGLGGGLVATGQIMKEQEKMNWETEQLKLKYDRDQHMQSLRLKADAEGRTEQNTWTAGQNDLTRAQQDKQNSTVNSNADRAFQLNKQQGDLAAGNAERAFQLNKQQGDTTAKNQAETLSIQKQEADAKGEYYKAEAASKTAEAASKKILSEMGELKFNAYKTLADKIEDPVKKAEFWLTIDKVQDKDGNKPPGEVVIEAMKQSNADVAAMTEKQLKETKTKLGISNIPDPLAKQQIQKMFMLQNIESPGIYSVGSSSKVSRLAGESQSTTQSGVLAGPSAKGSVLTKDDLNKVKGMDDTTYSNFILSLGNDNPLKLDLLKARPLNTSMEGAPADVKMGVVDSIRSDVQKVNANKARVIPPKNPNETDLAWRLRTGQGK